MPSSIRFNKLREDLAQMMMEWDNMKREED